MTDDTPSLKSRPLRTFGRTGGRALSARQQDLIDNLLPELEVPSADPGTLNPSDMFGDDRDIWLEIGFGGGEHLVGQAGLHPEVGFIGCEPFVEGMAKALTGIKDHDLGNDVKSYADKALARFLEHGGFDWGVNCADDWRRPPEDHLTTRYERKKLGDCAPVWLDFVRS